MVLASAVDDPRGDAFARAGMVLVAPMTVAFWAQGYGPVSIAFSTLVMGGWYGAIYFWWRGRSDRDRAFSSSLIYVVLASLGVWVLAPLQMAGHGDSLAASLAIHAFLSIFAWSLVLGALTFLHQAGYATATARRWWAVTAWALFPLGVVGGPETLGLGPLARLAGLLGLIPAYMVLRAMWSAPFHLRIASWWLAATATGLALVAVGGSGVLTTVGRAGTIFYLHATLLGCVTTVLAWHLGRRLDAAITRPLLAHHIWLAVMLGGVLLAAATNPAAGNWVAAIGALGVWVAGLGWALPLHREAR